MTGVEAISNQAVIEIVPVRIIAFDQIHLPFAVPFFEPLFPPNSIFRVIENFEMNESGNVVLCRERALGDVLAMLINPTDQVACNPDIQGSVLTTGKDVNEILFAGHTVSHNPLYVILRECGVSTHQLRKSEPTAEWIVPLRR